MRAIDRDLIRGGHYGQRSCDPHPKAEHMAAPTNAAYVKKALANSEPSTHGTKRTRRPLQKMSAFGEERTSSCMSTRPSQDSGVRYFIWQSDVLPARFMMALPPALIAKL